MTGNEELLAVTEAQYGDQYRNDFMTLYRDFVNSASQVSDRRHQANTFFSSINTVLLMATGLVPREVAEVLEVTTAHMELDWQFAIVAVAGCLLCWIWRKMIAAYRDLNSAKFKVINEIEQHLPLAAYDAEWKHFKAAQGNTLTSVEQRVPLMFMAAYAGVFLMYNWKYLEGLLA